MIFKFYYKNFIFLFSDFPNTLSLFAQCTLLFVSDINQDTASSKLNLPLPLAVPSPPFLCPALLPSPSLSFFTSLCSRWTCSNAHCATLSIFFVALFAVCFIFLLLLFFSLFCSPLLPSHLLLLFFHFRCHLSFSSCSVCF